MSEKLEDVHPEKTFMSHSGEEIKNLRQLLSVLTEISPESFTHHVNEEKNDFAHWVRDSVGDMDLADRLEQTYVFEETRQIINDRIIELEKTQEIENVGVEDMGIERPDLNIEKPPIEASEENPAAEDPTDEKPIEPISHHLHPFEHMKRGFSLTLRDALIGFVVGLVLGYIWGAF